MENFIENLQRISGAPWFPMMQKVYVDVIGVGGIGSYTAFALSRLGINNMNIFDGDIIEKVNLTGQLYNINDIGKQKSNAIGDKLNLYSPNVNINTYDHFNFIEYPMQPIVCCGFDSMSARISTFERWKTTINQESEQSYPILIDGRLAAEEFQIFAVTPDENIMEIYEKEWLFPDSEGDATVCSYKQTTFSAMMIGALIANILVNHIYNSATKTKLRLVPFLSEYEATTMRLITNTIL